MQLDRPHYKLPTIELPATAPNSPTSQQTEAKATFFLIKGKHVNDNSLIMNPNVLQLYIFISRNAGI